MIWGRTFIIKLSPSCKFAPLWINFRFEKLLKFRSRPFHGPYPKNHEIEPKWPWWHLFAIRFCKLTVFPPSTGYGMLFYSRWGWSRQDIVFDRRPFHVKDEAY